jgi:hypothetical protein
MANRTRTDPVERVEDATSIGASYERDFYAWSLEQARLIREGRWDCVDRENVAEEIESLSREQFDRLARTLSVLLAQMLQWDHQPDRRSRSRMLSISKQRLEVDDILADNPSLKLRIAEAVVRAYRWARLEAVKDTDIDDATIPETCRYSWDDIISREFSL